MQQKTENTKQNQVLKQQTTSNLQPKKNVQTKQPVQPVPATTNQVSINNQSVMQNSSIINKKQNQIPSLVVAQENTQNVKLQQNKEKVQKKQTPLLQVKTQIAMKSQKQIKQTKQQKQQIVKELKIPQQQKITSTINQNTKIPQGSKSIQISKNTQINKSNQKQTVSVQPQQKKAENPVTQIKEQKQQKQQKQPQSQKKIQQASKPQNLKQKQKEPLKAPKNDQTAQKVTKSLDNQQIVKNQNLEQKSDTKKSSQKVISPNNQPTTTKATSQTKIPQNKSKQPTQKNIDIPKQPPRINITQDHMTIQQLFDKFLYLLTLDKQKSDQQQKHHDKGGEKQKKIDFSISFGKPEQKEKKENASKNVKNSNKIRLQIGLLEELKAVTKLQSQVKQTINLGGDKEKPRQTNKIQQNQLPNNQPAVQPQKQVPKTSNLANNPAKSFVKLNILLYNQTQSNSNNSDSNLQKVISKINAKLNQHPPNYNDVKTTMQKSRKGDNIRIRIKQKNNSQTIPVQSENSVKQKKLQYILSKATLQKLSALINSSNKQPETTQNHEQQKQRFLQKPQEKKLISKSFIELSTFNDINMTQLKNKKILSHIFKGFQLKTSTSFNQDKISQNHVPSFTPLALHKIILGILPANLTSFLQSVKSGHMNLRFKKVQNLKALLSKLGIQQLFQQTPTFFQILKQIFSDNLKGLFAYKKATKPSSNKENKPTNESNKQNEMKQQLNQLWKIIKTVLRNSQTQGIRLQITLLDKLRINVIFQLIGNNKISVLAREIIEK